MCTLKCHQKQLLFVCMYIHHVRCACSTKVCSCKIFFCLLYNNNNNYVTLDRIIVIVSPVAWFGFHNHIKTDRQKRCKANKINTIFFLFPFQICGIYLTQKIVLNVPDCDFGIVGVMSCYTELEREVDRAIALCGRTEGHHVHVGQAELGECFSANPTAGLDDQVGERLFEGLRSHCECLRVEIIKHDDFRACLSGLCRFGETAALDLNLDTEPSCTPGLLYCRAHAPSRPDVVVLQHHHLREVVAVCRYPPNQQGVFFNHSESRGGFSRSGNFSGPSDSPFLVCQVTSVRGYAAGPRENIQSCPLCLQHSVHGTRDSGDLADRLEYGTFGVEPLHLASQLLKNGIEKWNTAKNSGRLAEEHGSLRLGSHHKATVVEARDVLAEPGEGEVAIVSWQEVTVVTCSCGGFRSHC